MGNLFASGELRAVFDVLARKMVDEIDAYDANRLQSASTQELTQYFYEKYMLERLDLKRKDAELENPPVEVQADARFFPDVFARPGGTVSAVRYTLRIPFEGSSELFYYQPSTYTSAGTPSGDVQPEHLVLSTTRRHTDPSTAVEAGFNSVLDDVMNHVGWANRDLEGWLLTLRRTAWERIEARKQRLQAAQATAKGMSFKLKERADAPKTFPAPEIRRKIQPKVAVPPPGSAAPYKAEPTLVDEEYEHILSVISRISIVMERSPHAFATMDEESLRTHLLVQLNGHYEGQATGETFNFEGKTDILIRAQGKNIFIAECKIWRGPKELLEAIDQLLGYTQWRDTKTAIIIFNRNKDFSAVVNQIRPVVESHARFKRFDKQVGETAFQFVFKQRDDEAREMVLTVLAFNVPLPSPATPGKS